MTYAENANKYAEKPQKVGGEGKFLTQDQRRDYHYNAIVKRINRATTFAKTLHACHYLTWHGATKNAPYESAAQQCIAEFAAWFPSCPADALEESQQRIANRFDAEFALFELRGDKLRVSYFINGERTDPSWKRINKARGNAGGGHPLNPILYAWHDAHPPIERHKRDGDRYFPVALLNDSHVEFSSDGDVDMKTVRGDYNHLHQRWLSIGVSTAPRTLPLASRLFMEVVLDGNVRHGGRVQRVIYTLNELLNALYPNGYRRHRFPQLQQAFRDVSEMKLATQTNGVWEVINPVLVVNPDVEFDLDAEVIIDLRLPQSSEKSVRMPRDALRRLATTSATAHRALFNLSVQFYRARRLGKGGHFIQPDPAKHPYHYPRLYKDDGDVVDRRGKDALAKIVFPDARSNERIMRKDAVDVIEQLADMNFVRIINGRIAHPFKRIRPKTDNR